MEKTHGNFVAFFNRDKTPGDSKASFDGRLSAPDSTDELRFALWAHEYTDPKSGEIKVMFNGQTGSLAANATPMDQIAALTKKTAESEATLNNLTLSARQIVLFPNSFKAEAPEKQRPDYWGAYNPGDGSPVVRLSVWAKKDRNQNPMLAGATSYPILGRSEPQMQDATAPNVEQMLEGGAVSKGMPDKKKVRSSRG